jgi:polysaccharide biosynthesis/export protein
MNTTSITHGCRPNNRHPLAALNAASRRLIGLFSLACGLLFIGSGCGTARSPALPSAAIPPEAQLLQPGDVLRIAFPRTPTLDNTQQIRRDGKINLYLVGEVTAERLSPSQLEERLLELYAPQLVSKEVRVTVISSAFSVFVTGAVLKPGKLTPERALTAFEAIMEAGGFDNARANTKAVSVIRTENGETKHFALDMKAVLKGKPAKPFYLQPYDVVHVPERFSWF